MKADAHQILNSLAPSPPQLAELLGAPQTDEEDHLRAVLGDGFVKAIELSLKLAETPDDRAADVLKALKDVLGEKEHLLSTVQRVAMQFELDK